MTSWGGAGDVLVVLAGIVYVASAVPLVMVLFRVSRWLLRHRRPELGTRTPDGILAFVLGAIAVAVVPAVIAGIVVGDRPWRWLSFMLVVVALVNGFFWIILRESFSVALVELRYTLAHRRVLRARAERRSDPDAEKAARQAEQDYLSIRHRRQEQ